jgi:predicted dienelactone hydrolase
MMRRVLLVGLLSLLAAACGSDVSSDDTNEQATPDAAHQADVADAGGADTTADSDTTLPPTPWPVDEPGPYKVGFVEHEVTYDAVGTDEPRTLRLAIWYPTLDKDGESAVYYDLIGGRAAFTDASVAIDEPAPLLLFSHGNSSMAEQSFFMTEFFASHGWVVASADHTGNTFKDTQGAIDLTAAVFRPQDISAVADHMLSLPDDDPLHGLASAEHIALSGHSFGGFTTLASAGGEFAVDELLDECDQNPSDMCDIFEGHDDWEDLFRQGFSDDRVKVAIPQAPGGYAAFRDGLSAIDTPTLLFTGGMDQTLPNPEEGDPIWQALEGPEHIRIDLRRAGHFTFSNMCLFFGGFEQVYDDGCSPDFIEPEDAFELINAYSLAYARYHLFGDDTDLDLLEGDVTPFEGIDLSHKPSP